MHSDDVVSPGKDVIVLEVNSDRKNVPPYRVSGSGQQASLQSVSPLQTENWNAKSVMKFIPYSILTDIGNQGGNVPSAYQPVQAV